MDSNPEPVDQSKIEGNVLTDTERIHCGIAIDQREIERVSTIFRAHLHQLSNYPHARWSKIPLRVREQVSKFRINASRNHIDERITHCRRPSLWTGRARAWVKPRKEQSRMRTSKPHLDHA